MQNYFVKIINIFLKNNSHFRFVIDWFLNYVDLKKNNFKGKWNHWENIGIPFEFPSCSSTENVLQEIEGNLNFNGFCSNYYEYQDEIVCYK